MKKLSLILMVAVSLTACKKSTTSTTPTTPVTPTTGCGDGNICFKLDGTAISKMAGGYDLSDTMLFVKYEEGSKQLSLDIFGKTTGSYNVSDVRKVGNARIYYFPDNNKMYMAETGTFNVSAYDAANKTVSGSFSGTLYEYDNNNNTFNKSSSVEIKDGEFVKVSVPK